MIYLTCPFCGPRDVTEFRYGSDAHLLRPKQPGTVSDEEWGNYLFMRDNPKGLMRERWMHVHGCRKWFNAVRNTVTDEVLAVYRMNEPPMDLDAAVGRPATAESDARPELKVLQSGESARASANLNRVDADSADASNAGANSDSSRGTTQ